MVHTGLQLAAVHILPRGDGRHREALDTQALDTQELLSCLPDKAFYKNPMKAILMCTVTIIKSVSTLSPARFGGGGGVGR